MQTNNQNNNEVQVANVALTKEQVIENLTVKAAKKYKSYVAAYVEKYTEPTAKVKKTLQELDMLDEKKLNTALRNFINGSTVKDVEEIKQRIKYSNFTPADMKALAEWATAEYEVVKVEYERKLIADKEAEVQKLMAEIEALKQQQ
nr:MAG TPA: hypothetical protein [Bacteriophage sp.]